MPRRFDRVQRSQARDLVLGIDYGTSTTKVMCRPFGERFATVVAAPGTDEVLWPSLVSIRDDVLFFGHDAADCPDPIRWLKMGLAHGPQNESVLQLEESYGVHPHVLAALFLAWVIGESRRAVFAALGDVRFTYNVAAPLDTLSDPSIEDRYSLTFFRAQELAAQARQAWPLAEALQAWDRVSGEAFELPPESERSTFVLSEVHAATCEVVRQQRLPDCHYAVLDIGAGTTDISVFLFRSSIQRDAVNGTIAYFASGVLGQACNAVDHRIIGALNDAGLRDSSGIWSRLLQAKQSSRDGSITVDGVSLNAAQVRDLARQISDNIHGLYAAVVAEAFQKEPRPENWPEIKLLFIGGGGQFRPFQDRVQADFPLACIRKVDIEQLHLGERPNLLVRDQLVERAVPEYLFVVASGLSYHISQIPEEIRPSAVVPLPTAHDPHRQQATTVFCTCNGLNPQCYLCGGTGRGPGLDDDAVQSRRTPAINIAEHTHCRFCGNIVATASFASHLRAHHPDSPLLWHEPKEPLRHTAPVEEPPCITLADLLAEWRAAHRQGGIGALPEQLLNLMRSYHEVEGIPDRDKANLEQVVRSVRGARQLSEPYSVITVNLHLLALLRLGYLDAFHTAVADANYEADVLDDLRLLCSILWNDQEQHAAGSRPVTLSDVSFRLDDEELALEIANPGEATAPRCDWLAELARLSACRLRGKEIPERLIKAVAASAPDTPDVRAKLRRLRDD